MYIHGHFTIGRLILFPIACFKELNDILLSSWTIFGKPLYKHWTMFSCCDGTIVIHNRSDWWWSHGLGLRVRVAVRFLIKVMYQNASLVQTIFVMFNDLPHTLQKEQLRSYWKNQRSRYHQLEQRTLNDQNSTDKINDLDIIDWSNACHSFNQESSINLHIHLKLGKQ